MPPNAQAIKNLYTQYSTRAIQDFKKSLSDRNNQKSVEMFSVLCELNKRDEAIKNYIEHVCTEQIYYAASPNTSDEHDKFLEEH